MRALFMFAVLALLPGCALTKHPFVQWATNPSDLVRTAAESTTIRAEVDITGKIPFYQPGYIHAESDGMVTIITVTPPVDPEEFAQEWRQAQQRFGPQPVRVDTVGVHEKGVQQ